MSEAASLMRQAAAEMRQLRRENEILRAKVDTMDLLACMLFSQPARQGVGMSEDVAWKLDRSADAADQAEAEASVQQQQKP